MAMAALQPLAQFSLAHDNPLTLIPDEADNKYLAVLKLTMREDLTGNRRCGYLLGFQNFSNPIMLAVYLDPRTKSFSFIKDPTVRENVLTRCDLAIRHSLSSTNFKPEIAAPRQLVSSVKEKSSLCSNKNVEMRLERVFRDVHEEYDTPSDDQLEREMQSYRNMFAIPMFTEGYSADPLQWWKYNATVYQRLAQLARGHLCISATTVHSERAFSKAGWIVNKRRSGLSDTNVEMLLFLSENFCHLKQE